ncbi:MAG: hypothetical protein WBQ85_18350 [Candidatus Sulfotelmatobacter sp.]
MKGRGFSRAITYLLANKCTELRERLGYDTNAGNTVEERRFSAA